MSWFWWACLFLPLLLAAVIYTTRRRRPSRPPLPAQTLAYSLADGRQLQPASGQQDGQDAFRYDPADPTPALAPIRWTTPPWRHGVMCWRTRRRRSPPT